MPESRVFCRIACKNAVLISYFARIRLFLGLCSSSTSPSSSIRGGRYIPKRPLRPFFNPSPPPTGLSGERPHASTVPSFAGFCSSALPSSIQSPCCLSISCRSLMQRRSYCNTVFPTVHTRIGGLCASSLYIVYPDAPDGVVSSQGCSFVPLASAIVTSSFFGRWSAFRLYIGLFNTSSSRTGLSPKILPEHGIGQ